MVTAKQHKIYQYISDYVQEEGYAPTLQEIANAMGLKTRSAIHRHMQALEKAGLLRLSSYRHRGIELINPETAPEKPRQASLPLVGTIAAGEPIEAIEQPELLDLYGVFGGAEHFALRVRGDSMIEEGILDGDVVVCKKAVTADDGAIVVALIDGREATLKRIKREIPGYILLIPANSQLAGMRYAIERVQIQGIFIGLLRLGAGR